MRHRVPRDDRGLLRAASRSRVAEAALPDLAQRDHFGGADGHRRSAAASDEGRQGRSRATRPAALSLHTALANEPLRGSHRRRQAHDPHQRSCKRRTHDRDQRSVGGVHGGRVGNVAKRRLQALEGRSTGAAQRTVRAARRLAASLEPGADARARPRNLRRREPIVPAMGDRSRSRVGGPGSACYVGARVRPSRAHEGGDSGAALMGNHAFWHRAHCAVARECIQPPVAPAFAVFREASSRRHRFAVPFDRYDSAHADVGICRGDCRRAHVHRDCRDAPLVQPRANGRVPRRLGSVRRHALAGVRSLALGDSRANRARRETGESFPGDRARCALHQAVRSAKRAPRRLAGAARRAGECGSARAEAPDRLQASERPSARARERPRDLARRAARAERRLQRRNAARLHGLQGAIRCARQLARRQVLRCQDVAGAR